MGIIRVFIYSYFSKLIYYLLESCIGGLDVGEGGLVGVVRVVHQEVLGYESGRFEE